MPRRVEDIVPNSRRSIRDIPIGDRESQRQQAQSGERSAPSQRRRTVDSVSKTTSRPKESSIPIRRMPFTPPMPKIKRKKRWPFVLLAIIVIVTAGAWAGSSRFSYATFTLVPKSVEIAIDDTIVVGSADTASNSQFGYKLITVTDTASQDVPASSGQNVSVKSQGTVTLYNLYSTQAQRLVAGTRLANDSGLIYRLTDSVLIPGYTTTGGVKKAGTVTAKVLADEAGEKYNITKSTSIKDFKIVAYKGGPRYDSFYAKIATDITGGFVGVKKIIPDEVLSSTSETLEKDLEEKLVTTAKSKLEEGEIMYDKAYIHEFSPASLGGTNPELATVSVTGTIYAVVFDKQSLINKLAKEEAESAFSGSAYESNELGDLSFSIANASDFDPTSKDSLIIKLKGPLVLKGSIPAGEIASKLKGLSLPETAPVLRQYSSVIDIAKSTGEVIPPWSKVPTDTSRISVRTDK